MENKIETITKVVNPQTHIDTHPRPVWLLLTGKHCNIGRIVTN